MESHYLINALELEKQNNWNAAHKIVQSYNSREACWIHAYLHRKEGDLSNANYWYRRANREMPNYDLFKEWEIIFEHISAI